MMGVVSGHTIHEANTVRNSRDHACCMPTARMPATIWVAFTSAKPSQSKAIQRQEYDGRVDG